MSLPGTLIPRHVANSGTVPIQLPNYFIYVAIHVGQYTASNCSVATNQAYKYSYNASLHRGTLIGRAVKLWDDNPEARVWFLVTAPPCIDIYNSVMPLINSSVFHHVSNVPHATELIKCTEA